MIGKVTNIIEKTTAKNTLYLNVTLDVNGKKVAINSFDTTDNYTFKQAFEQGKALEVEMEKNEKGYDQLKNVRYAETATQTPVSHVEAPPVQKPNIVTPGQEIGMTVKEIGDMLRVGQLALIFGDADARVLAEWYRLRIKSTVKNSPLT